MSWDGAEETAYNLGLGTFPSASPGSLLAAPTAFPRPQSGLQNKNLCGETTLAWVWAPLGSQRKAIPCLQVSLSHRIHKCPHLQQLSRTVASVDSRLQQEPLLQRPVHLFNPRALRGGRSALTSGFLVAWALEPCSKAENTKP